MTEHTEKPTYDEVAALREQIRRMATVNDCLRAERDAETRRADDNYDVMKRAEAKVERLLTANGMLEAIIKDAYEKHEGETCGRVQCRNATNALRAELTQTTDERNALLHSREIMRDERDEAVKAAKYAIDTGVRDRIARRKSEADVERMRPVVDKLEAALRQYANFQRGAFHDGAPNYVRDALTAVDAYREASKQETNPGHDGIDASYESLGLTSKQETTDALRVGQDERVDRMMEAD